MTSAEWETIRITENYQSHGPVQDVTSAAMTCYQRDVGTGAAKIVSVKAGGSVSFTVDTSIGHPGPLHFYLAKVPSGQTAATFDGKGAVWFKIYQDGPSGLGTSSITWPSSGSSFLPFPHPIQQPLPNPPIHNRQNHRNGPTPLLPRQRRLPPARGAHRTALGQQRRRRAAVHWVCAADCHGRLGHDQHGRQAGLVPWRVLGHGPGDFVSVVLACADELC